MAEHTKGRLKVAESCSACFLDTEDTEASNGLRIADVQGDDLISPAEARANARRLAACWNLLEGFSTEAIEDRLAAKGDVRVLIDHIKGTSVATPRVRPPFYVEPDSNYDLPVSRDQP